MTMTRTISSVRIAARNLYAIAAFLVVFGFVLSADVSSVCADECRNCPEVSNYASKAPLLLRIQKSKVPKNGHHKIGRIDNLNIIGVFKKGELVDYYLKNPKSGKKIFGSTQVKTAKIFSKCFQKKKFGVTLKICITVDVSIF